MRPCILFRKDFTTEAEYARSLQYFDVFQSRMDLHNRLVIGRYSVLPYYRELESDLAVNGSRLINSLRQHQWVANFEYYEELHSFTAESWWSLADTSYEGPFVVKGMTNSRKYDWNTHMFAATRREAMEVASRLHGDGLIGTQDLIYRRYVPLKTLEVGLNGIRFANEWRLFYLGTKCLSYGYYWSSAEPETIARAMFPVKALHFADSVAAIAASHCNFFVLDVAETESGEWMLVEVNDGQMSGLSENNPNILYASLRDALNGREW